MDIAKLKGEVAHERVVRKNKEEYSVLAAQVLSASHVCAVRKSRACSKGGGDGARAGGAEEQGGVLRPRRPGLSASHVYVVRKSRVCSEEVACV